MGRSKSFMYVRICGISVLFIIFKFLNIFGTLSYYILAFHLLTKNDLILKIIISCFSEFQCYRDWPVSPPPIQAARRWTSGFLRPLMRTWPPAGSEPLVVAGVQLQLLPQHPQLPAASAPVSGRCLRLSGWCALPRCCPAPERNGLSCRRWSTAVWGRPAPLEGRTLWSCQTETFSYWRGDSYFYFQQWCSLKLFHYKARHASISKCVTNSLTAFNL